jgi:aconitate hydratase 2 / 2-methylisocitrate dehydratase
MLDTYLKHEAERNSQGIPAKPLDSEQTADLCKLIENPPTGKEQFLLHLLRDCVSPGVDPAAGVKAAFLAEIVRGTKKSLLISKEDAVQILGTMIGGYNVAPLIAALKDAQLADVAAKALSNITLVYNGFDEVAALSKTNSAAKRVLESWANAEWFTKRTGVPATVKVKIFKVEGEINTDDFSPGADAWSRPDIPLHALTMGKSRFPGGIATMATYRAAGHQVAFVGDVVGTGSSRKSAINSVLWHIGYDVPFVPNKKTGGIIIGGAIAPIFFNTAEDSGVLPIKTDVTKLKTGDEIIIDTVTGKIKSDGGLVISTFKLLPNTLPDEFRAGGRIPLIIGRALTAKARTALGVGPATIFSLPVNPAPKGGQGYTLAQKIVGKNCGVMGVLPGTACEPTMTTVGSQDTLGLLNADELRELACLKFQAPMYMQSFCHTAAYPKPPDVKMYETLPRFAIERCGVALRPGDGIIHSWINRLLLPDTVGTGSDSHTRFPIGISFAAGSGLVAFAGAMGFMPLDMPESVLVRFRGKLNPGITLRDVVNAIPYYAIKQGFLTVPKKNKVNVFNGRILEMEGLPNLSVEQAFELTNATAERSAAAGCIQLSKESVATYLRSNVSLMKKLIKDGYKDDGTLRKRIADVEAWLAKPVLLEADQNAEYAAVIEINLSEITEPILACPNDPDDVKLLSAVAGTPVQDVFLGSCMTNIGHFRAAAEIWRGQKPNPAIRTWLCPPTRMDHQQLKDEGLFAIYCGVNARIEVPGCSLCMGNQARVHDGVTVYSTSTRNFDNRLGDGTKVFLGSAELGAVIASMGKIPTPTEYLAVYMEKIEPKKNTIYKYLQFDKMEKYN